MISKASRPRLAGGLTWALLALAACSCADSLPRAASPEAVGYRSSGLDLARVYLESQPTSAAVALSDGLVFFEYGEPAELYDLASVRKSVLGLLYGKYVADGTIDLSTTLEQLGLDDVGGLLEIERKATIRDLLMARSGVYHPAANPGDDFDAAPERGSKRPGEFFLYNNWDFNAAGAIFEKLTGKSIYEALEEDLAEPLGMQDYDAQIQSKGGSRKRSRFPAYYLMMSTRDLARIGQLMLNRGRWGKKQVVPAEWVDELVQVRTPHERIYPDRRRKEPLGYGMMWWVWDGPEARGAFAGAYTARGLYGQYITVLPAAGLVVAHNTRALRDADGRRSGVEWETYEGFLRRLLAARASQDDFGAGSSQAGGSDSTP